MAHMKTSRNIWGWYYYGKIFFLVLFWLKKIIFLPIIVYFLFYSKMVIIWILHLIQTYNNTIESKDIESNNSVNKIGHVAEWLRRGLQILFVYDLTLIISLLINIFTFNKDCKYSPVPLIQSPLLKAKPLGFGGILWKNQVQSLSSIANQNSKEFRWLLSELSLKEAHLSFNFQSFPRVRSLLPRKEYITPLLIYSDPGSQSLQKHSWFFK